MKLILRYGYLKLSIICFLISGLGYQAIASVHDTFSIFTLNAVISNYNGFNVSCKGGSEGSIDLTVNGGTAPFVFLWSNGETNEDITNISAGTFTVTVQDNDGTIDSLVVTLTEPDLISVSTDLLTNINCNGNSTGAISITASGGTSAYSFLWNDASTLEDRTSLTTGTYSATVTDANGCTATASFEITSPSALNIVTDLLTNINCNGNSTGAISITASGGTSAYSFLWNDASTLEDRISLTAGTYSATVTDANGCTATASFEITSPSALNIATDLLTNVNCNGNSTGAISITASGGTSAYSFLWNDASTLEDRISLTAGTYSATVTDANGCTATASFEITSPSALNIATDLLTNVNCNGNSNGAISITASGGTSAYSFLWNDASTLEDRTSLTAGTYSATVTDANGCTSTATFEITQPSALNIATDLLTNVNCNGNSNGAISITASGGTSPYSFLWSDSTTDEDRTSLSAGTYSATVTDANGCTSTATFEITSPSALNIATDLLTNINCNGNSTGAISITASGGTSAYSFLWNDASTLEDRTSLAAGTYSVTVTDANSCTTTASFEITQPSALNIATDLLTNINCNGNSTGAISITASGGTSPYSFLWSDSTTDEDRTSLSAGTYSATVTDANGCTSTATFEITSPSALNIATDLLTNINCNGNSTGAISITASGGTSAYSFLWNDASTLEDRTSLAAGTYSVTVTDANSCTTTASFEITQPSALNIATDLLTNVNCNGNSNGAISITASGGTSPYSFLWSDSTTDEDRTSLSAGTYSATVTDANGCTSTASFEITQPDSIIVNASVNAASCGQSNGSIILNASGGTGLYLYQWNNGSTDATLINISAGSYTATVTDANSCSKTKVIAVNNQSGPGISVDTVINLKCNGDANGAIHISVNGGVSPYTYLWSNGVTTEDVSNVAAGTYTITVTDFSGCQTTVNATVIQPDLLVINFNVTNEACFQSNGNIETTITGGTGIYQYLWNNGVTNDGLSNLAAATYSVTVTDQNNCSATASIAVSNISGPVLSIQNYSNVSCYGNNSGSITIATTGTQPFSYLWSNASTLQNLTALIAGTYSVTVFDVNNCSASASQIITQPDSISVNSTIVAASCGQTNGSITLSATGGTGLYSYLWNNGSTNAALINISAGSYTVTVTDANSCSKTKVIAVNNQSGPVVTISSFTNVLCHDDSTGFILISITGGTLPYTFLWSNGITNQNLVNIPNGIYSVTVTDFTGCIGTVSKSISEPSVININVSSVNPACGFSNGAATAAAVGGTGTLGFLWSNGATDFSVSNLAAGTYTVTVTDANACSKTKSVTLNNVAGPAVTISSSGNVSCFGGNNGFINLTVTGGNSPYQYLWSSSATTKNINLLIANVYTVTVTDQSNCTSTVSLTITQPQVIAISTTVQPANCNQSNGGIAAIVTGGLLPYTYLWNTGATIDSIINLLPGTYTLTVTDTKGCTKSASTIVLNQGAPNVSVSTFTNISCYGGSTGSINTIVSGGVTPYSFLWSNSATSQNVTALVAGTYTVTVSDNNGCTKTLSKQLTQAPQINVSLNVTNAKCNINNGTVYSNVTGGTGSFTYLWNNGNTNSLVNNLPAGTYTLTVTDQAGCTKSGSMSVIQTGSPVITLQNVTNNLCYGQNIGAISINSTGGVLPYAYFWNNSTTTKNNSGLFAGTYTVTVTDNSGCTSTLSATVSQPPQISISTNSVNATCGQSNGSVSVTAIGGNGTLSYLWTGGATTSTVNNLPQGVYTVTVTDQSSCSKTASSAVNSVNGPIINVQNVTNVKCFGESNGSINVNIINGVQPYSFNWSNGATVQNISNISAGTYTLTVTDANVCPAGIVVTVSQPAQLILNLTANNATCGNNNGSASVIAQGGTGNVNFFWSSGSTSNAISNLSAGIYTVIGIDQKGCSATSSAVIANESSPVISLAGKTDVKCNGSATGAVTININGGELPFAFLWSNGATTQNINSIGAGSYTVTVTDNNGCSASFTTQITQPNALLLSINNISASCSSANGSLTAIISGGVTPFNLLWSNGATTSTISNLFAATYTVTITDNNLCVLIDSAVVGNVSGPVIALSNLQNASCNGAMDGTIEINISSGTTPYSFNWSDGSTDQNLFNTGAGIYTVVVTDDNNCSSSTSFTVTQPPSIDIQSTIIQPTCGDANGEINLSVTGGAGNFAFQWSNGATTDTIKNLLSGTYTVVITDGASCSASKIINLSSSNGPLISFVSVVNVLCHNTATASIDATVSGGTPPYIYNWSNGTTLEDLINIPSGYYNLQVTDSAGCSGSVDTVVTQPSKITLSLSKTNSTCGLSNGIVQVGATGGTGAYSYLWNNGATTDTVKNVVAGNYIVVVTDQNGCTKTGSVAVSTTLVPQVLLTIKDDVNCFGGSTGLINISVSGGAPFQYSWSNGSTNQDIFGLHAGNYSVSVTNQFGCTDTASFQITQPDSLFCILSSQTATCTAANGSAQIVTTGGSGGYTYLWNNGTTSAFNSGLSPGTYTVTVTDINSCTHKSSVTVNDLPGPQVLPFFIKNINCFNSSDGIIDIIVVGSSPPFSYLWSGGQTTQDISVLPPGTYSVAVTDTNNCVSVFDTILTQPDLLQIVFDFTNPSCGNGNGKIKAIVSGGVPPYSYFWSTGATVDSLSNLSPGNYSLTITDQNTCTDFNNINLNNTGGVFIAIDSIVNEKCAGLNNGGVYLKVTSFYTPLTYLWSNGSTSEDLQNVSANTYTVVITDSLGCQTINSYQVTEPLPLTDTVAGTNPICGLNNGAAVTAVLGGTAPYSYLWSNGFTANPVSSLFAGTYSVTITDDNGCVKIDSVKLTDPGAPILAIDTLVNIKCFGSSTGLIKVKTTQGQGTINYLWSTGSTASVLVNLTAGTYTVTANDQNGCKDSINITITQPLSLAVAFTPVNPICALNNGSVNAIASGGVSPYSYIWSNGFTTQTISNLAPGTYTVTILDFNNCIYTDSIKLTDNGIPQAVLDSTVNASCYNSNTGSLLISVANGSLPFSFIWSNGKTTEDINALIAGTYTVTVSDINGCSSSGIFSLTQPAQLQLNINSVNTTCNSSNGSANAIVTGGVQPYSYLWNTGATTDIVNNLGAATYTVTATDKNNCTTTSTTIISNLDGPQVSASVIDSVSCFNLSDGSINLTITGVASPFSFLWSNGSTDQNVFSLTAGVYSVTITDTNNCVTVYSDTIRQPDILAVSFITNAASCGIANGSAEATVTGGTVPYNYLWSNSSGNSNIVAVAAGTYTVVITDANNCTLLDSTTIFNPAAPVINNSIVNNVLCFGGTTGSISIDVSGTSLPFTYSWSNQSTLEDISQLTAGTYTITITDTAFCMTTSSYVVTQPDDIFVAVSIIDALCNDSTGAITISNITGGVGPYSYTWSNGGTTAAISSLTAGVYTLTVIDFSGCSKDTSIVVNNISGPAVQIDSAVNVSCFGGSNGAIYISVSGNNPPLNLLWSNGSSVEDISNLTVGTYTITVTDANNCKVILPVNLTQPSQLNYSFTLSSNNPPYNISCAGLQDGSIDFSPAGGIAPYNFLWSIGTTNEDVNNLGQGIYTVSVTDNNGCTLTASFSLSAPPPISANAGTNQVLCAVDSFLLNATPPIIGLGNWNVTAGAGTFANPSLYNTVVYGLANGVNVLTWVVSYGNCSDTSSIIIDVTSQVTANAGIDLEVCESEITLSATQPQFGFGFWQTITGSGIITDSLSATTLVNNLNVGTNQFQWVVNNGGCSDSDIVIIIRLDSITCLQPVEMPTGFTPNGDGKNDYFIIKNIEDYGVNTLSIYNRWGNIVYEKQRYMNDWDGTGKDGKPLPDGTYFYTLSIKGVEKTIKGYIDLRR